MQKELVDDKLESQSKEADANASILGEGDSIAENPNASNNATAAISDVAKVSKNNLIIIVAALALGAIALIYFVYYKNTPKSQPDDGGPFAAKKQPTRAQDIPMPSLGSSSRPDTSIAMTAPTLTPIQEKNVQPQTPASPPPLPKLPDLPKADSTPAPPALPKADASQQNGQNRQDAKIKSSIMLTGGGGAGATQGSGTTSKGAPISAATAEGDFVPDFTSATSSQVTTVGDLSVTITQGKVLDAVLETPINTNYQGPIRAIVSRDAYSDKGSNILIPKGSRLIGALKGGYSPGMTRVMIDWSRIIMPSGYDVAISGSPGISPSGMIGVEGYIDRQFLETLGTTAMLSVINIAMAKIIEDKFKIQPSTTIDQTGTNGNIKTSTNLTPTQQTAQNELQNLSDATTNWLKQNFVPTPYIVIDQGTRVKVFVNQDIRFPKNLNTNISMVR